MRHTNLLLLIIVASFAIGCQSSPTDRDAATTTRATSQAQTPNAIAYIDGQIASRDALFALLAEAHGGEALAELVLDRRVAKRLAGEGIVLTPQDLERERERLKSDLSADEDEGQRLINAMRSRLGLGDKRYAALLKRNAGMRRLVRDGISITEPAIRQAYELRYGDRYRARLMTAADVNTLSRARQRVLNGTSFTDLAIELSTDASAAQGGLLSPISPADASYPKAVRDALVKLSAKDRASRLSPVIALADGYALLWLEQIVKRDKPPFATVREELAQAVYRDLERVRMRQLARTLIESANIVVLDPALSRSWKDHQEAINKSQ